MSTQPFISLSTIILNFSAAFSTIGGLNVHLNKWAKKNLIKTFNGGDRHKEIRWNGQFMV